MLPVHYVSNEMSTYPRFGSVDKAMLARGTLSTPSMGAKYPLLIGTQVLIFHKVILFLSIYYLMYLVLVKKIITSYCHHDI